MQVARTAYLLNAFEAAKFMLRTGTTLAPSASARTVTRSPHSPSRRGISAPRRCCSHRSETSSHERGLRRSKPAHHRNAVAKSRAGPAKAVGRYWVAGFPPARGIASRALYLLAKTGQRRIGAGGLKTPMAHASAVDDSTSPGPSCDLTESRNSGPPVPSRHSPHARSAAPGPAPATPTPSGGPASWPRWLATPRAPPRPRGGENRAGERVPPLFVLEPTGPAGQRTKRTFFVPGGAEPCWYTPWALWERVKRTQGRFIAHLAGSWFRGVASTFVVGGPQNPKDPGFGGFSPFALRWCHPFGLKTPASCRTREPDCPTFWLQKSVITDFLS